MVLADAKLTLVIGSCPFYHPKKIYLFGGPGCISGTGGWALLRGFYELNVRPSLAKSR